MNYSKSKEKLKSVKVTGLFGRFDHEIKFHDQRDLIIIAAPNGHGKTVMLRIIDSLFKGKFHFFSKLSFEEIVISFVSGKSIFLFKSGVSLFADEENLRKDTFLKSLGFGDDNEEYNLSNSYNEVNWRMVENRLPLERVGIDSWQHYSSDRKISTMQMLENYSDLIPDKYLKLLKMPEWLKTASVSVNSHLIETQRLLLIDHNKMAHERPYGGDGVSTSSVVEKDALDLSKRISLVLQEYAQKAQQLDQSFPQRIIELQEVEVPEEAEIRKQLEELNSRRDELVSAGLLGKILSEAIKPSDRFSEEQVRKILSIYITDTKTKLSVFDKIYSKIRLFREILNDHFSFKEILINLKDGIKVVDKDTKIEIPLSELSSGEQHELVLIYELLFVVEDGSLILIDEPELSLHVAWQKRFISDLQMIQKLKPLEVIIATHSPQIINDRWDLVQELQA